MSSPPGEPIPNERLDPAFRPLLARFDLARLEALPDAAYGVWRTDLRLAYVNPAWARFAEENGGRSVTGDWPLGRSLAECLPTPLERFYLDAWSGCVRSGEPWSHDYECSSPTVYRLFHQVVYPLGAGGLLVTNALREERAPDAPDHTPDRARFERDGIITTCSHCRCFRDVDDRWRRVSEWVRQMPPMVSHGLCPACFGWYYGDL